MSGPAPLAVDFAYTATGGVPPYRFTLDFGDGTMAHQAQAPGTVSHTYQNMGDYNPVLQVIDSQAQQASTYLYIQVRPPLPPPPPGLGAVGGQVRVTVAKRPGRMTLVSARRADGNPGGSTRADLGGVYALNLPAGEYERTARALLLQETRIITILEGRTLGVDFDLALLSPALNDIRWRVVPQ